LRKLFVILGLTLVPAAALVLASQLVWAEQPGASWYLAVSASDEGGNDSVLVLKTQDNITHIGVRGGRPFQLIVRSSYPQAPYRVLVALTDGQVYPVDDMRLKYSCDYFVRCYGLLIAEYPGDVIEMLPFRVVPAWMPEEESTIPEEQPPLKEPVSGDSRIQSEIDIWWDTVVIPQEKFIRHEQGEPCQFDEPETPGKEK